MFTQKNLYKTKKKSLFTVAQEKSFMYSRALLNYIQLK